MWGYVYGSKNWKRGEKEKFSQDKIEHLKQISTVACRWTRATNCLVCTVLYT